MRCWWLKRICRRRLMEGSELPKRFRWLNNICGRRFKIYGKRCKWTNRSCGTRLWFNIRERKLLKKFNRSRCRWLRIYGRRLLRGRKLIRQNYRTKCRWFSKICGRRLLERSKINGWRLPDRSKLMGKIYGRTGRSKLLTKINKRRCW